MYVYWKPLLLLGFLFWIALFSTDVFRKHKIFQSSVPEPPHSFAPTKKTTVEEKKSSSTVYLEATSSDKLSSDLGLTMVFVNIVIFLVSLLFCSIAKFVATIICKYLRKSEVQSPILEKSAPVETCPIGDVIKDPIPFEEIPCGDRILRTTTGSNTELRESADQICQTIFHSAVPLKYDQALRAECSRLREELLTVQSNSIKEHALLSRKLDAMAKEKRDLNKRLNVILKENNVAKVEINGLLEDKKILQKRLDSATKEARLNTKTKKVALAKLEEISASVEDLKRQLEQVTRDKEILQGKLHVLRNEYEKLQERLRTMQIREASRMNEVRATNIEIEKAEKDENVAESTNVKLNDEQLTGDNSQSSLNRLMSKESVFLPYVISQTEIDMKNIQMKILQLEKSMKGFDSKTNMLEEISRFENDTELDLGSSLNKSSDEAEKLDDRLSSVLAKMKATRDDLSNKKTYDEIKVETLRSALKQKIKILETMKERGDESSRTGCMSEATTIGDDEFEMSSEEASSPRFLSNSQAFQKFLKHIGAETTMINIGDSNLNTEYKMEN
ncbi:intracellular protein transport protein USO1-like isoform X2 [Harmonia axyridis]|uniref:intracellular protein transport protein USO1-like isoform X2 n=1 Tax=Harmonia axyridis TaxID=115357 RepID=UPI001E277B66|nr:intracellular protein transport protein USO1-like isoform X2 [Harmonia axyridis]